MGKKMVSTVMANRRGQKGWLKAGRGLAFIILGYGERAIRSFKTDC